jgi:raffinose/stachyose/melibiose transport system substrate-binding protein
MSRLSFNHLGLLLLIVAFMASVWQVVATARQSGEGIGAGDLRVVRIAHWQLEPGYRQAMQEVIDQYNNLPHVRQANVEVRQSPVTEKVFNQWLNVQLMSGTAPDISEKGMARLTQGSAFTGKYFLPLGALANEPNPYNAARHLPNDLDPQLAQALSTLPWRETFIDGMRGGWDEQLQDFYGVPTSFFGAVRLFYNKTLMAQAKQMIRQGLAQPTRPDWMEPRVAGGFVVVDDALRRWAGDEQPPDTLGRLLLVCSAVQEMARVTGNSKLVPIAGSRYSQWMFAGSYKVPFTASLSKDLDRDLDSSVTDLESYAGWRRGVWTFNTPQVEAYFACLHEITRQFPPGFLALERDQANNRFVLGNAAMIASGAWDAGSLVQGAQSRARAEERFEIGIIPLPLPGPGEKWSEYVLDRVNEAQTNAGAVYSIDQRSPNRQFAIDFLQYLGSYSVNQQLNRAAQWIPVVLGTSPSKQMMAFRPNPHGLYQGSGLNFETNFSSIRTVVDGQLWLYMSGDQTYDGFVGRVTQALEDPRMGINRMYNLAAQNQSDQQRNQERVLAVHASRRLLLDLPEAADAYRRTVSESVRTNNGSPARSFWHRTFPEEPFPEF